MTQDAYEVLKRVKKCTELLTDDVAYMMKHVKQFSLAFEHDPEFDGRHDEHKIKMVATQETIVELARLTMQLRKELIFIGATYEEKTPTTEVYHETQD